MPTLCTLKVHGCAPCRLDVDCFQTTGLGCASSQTARPGASVSARTSGEARRASAPVSGGWFSWSASFWTSASSLSSSRSKAFSSRSSSPASDASPPRSFCPCWPRAFSRLRSGWRFFCSLRSLSEPLPSAAETWRGIENARERTAMPVSNAMFFIKDCCEHGGRDLLQGWEQDDAGNRCSVERGSVRPVGLPAPGGTGHNRRRGHLCQRVTASLQRTRAVLIWWTLMSADGSWFWVGLGGVPAWTGCRLLGARARR